MDARCRQYVALSGACANKTFCDFRQRTSTTSTLNNIMNFNENAAGADQIYAAPIQELQPQQPQQHPQMQPTRTQPNSSQQQLGDANIYSMLPPQFANLTPQQLNQLRQQPQFQTMLRNYVQRQQQQQMQQQQQQHQQQQQQHQQRLNNVPPQHMSPSMQQLPRQAMQHTPASDTLQAQQKAQQLFQQQLAQQQLAQGAASASPAAQNLVSRQPMQASGVAVGTAAQSPHMIPQPYQQDVALHLQQQQLQLRQASISLASARQSLLQQQQQQRMMQGSAPQMRQPLGLAVPMPMKDAFPMGNAGNGPLPLNPPTVPEGVPHRDLTSLKEWSQKLQQDGKEVPTNVRVYESMIERDNKFLNAMAKQQAASKRELDLLLHDVKTLNVIKQLRMNAIALSHKGHFNNSIWGEGYQGYGNGISNTYTRLVFPKDLDKYSTPALRNITASENLMTDLQMSEKVAQVIGKPRDLVPIRLEFDSERDRFKLRDTFLWNLNENAFSLEKFVAILIDDYKFIPPQSFDNILASIKEQIRDYRKQPQLTLGELRVAIKVDITINNTQLVDQFEWDILNFEENDPEEFATVLCDELGLPGEFATAVAHSIREQIQIFYKALYMIGYSFDGSVVHEDDIRSRILPQLRIPLAHTYGRLYGSGNTGLSDDFYSILRNPAAINDNTPVLVKLTQSEIDRFDKEMEREARRKRRHNASDDTGVSFGGVANGNAGRGILSRRTALHGSGRGGASGLPDLSEVPKTFRTPAPSSILPGGVDLGVPDVYVYNEVAVHRTLVKNPEFKQQNNRVRFNHDYANGRFLVHINMR